MKVTITFEDLPDGNDQVKVVCSPPMSEIKKSAQLGQKATPAQAMAGYCALMALAFSDRTKKDKAKAQRALVLDLNEPF